MNNHLCYQVGPGSKGDFSGQTGKKIDENPLKRMILTFYWSKGFMFNPKLGHLIVNGFNYSSFRKFNRGLVDVEKTQGAVLSRTLKLLTRHQHPLIKKLSISSYSEFRKNIPITDYQFWEKFILESGRETSSLCPHFVRYQPTSGSTDQIKWIPYGREMLQDFNSALGPWLYDIYRNYPSVARGRHYWSLSWVPQSLRQQGVIIDDTQLFPLWRRWILQSTMNISQPFDQLPSMDSALFASLCTMIADKSLSMISVWSPSFLIQLVELLRKWVDPLSESLKSGVWSLFADELEQYPCPLEKNQASILKSSEDLLEIWPQLALISCWTTGQSNFYIPSINQLFPKVPIQGKGLWATEGVVTIPFSGKYVLASQSHFYEFRNLENDSILSSQQLKIGMMVEPLLTTTGGFLRYRLPDLLEVDGVLGNTPTLRFVGRNSGVDLVGEKISNLAAQKFIAELKTEGVPACYLIAKQSLNQPNYFLILKASAEQFELKKIEQRLEMKLREFFHYNLARDLGQLSQARIILSNDPDLNYKNLMLSRGQILGNIKMEPIICINENELRENFCES